MAPGSRWLIFRVKSPAALMLKETRSVLSALEEIENGCLVIAKGDLPTVIQANCPGSKVKPSNLLA